MPEKNEYPKSKRSLTTSQWLPTALFVVIALAIYTNSVSSIIAGSFCIVSALVVWLINGSRESPHEEVPEPAAKDHELPSSFSSYTGEPQFVPKADEQPSEKNRLSANDLFDEISSVASEIQPVASDLANEPEQTADQASGMNQKLHYHPNDITNISTTVMEISSFSSNNTASSTGELGSTTNEMDQNGSQQSSVANMDKDKTAATLQGMSELGDAANEISSVFRVNGNSTEQTNLLALHTTIESVSAMDAGKDFAEVESAVKELSTKSSGAASQIIEKIQSIQNNAEKSIHDITDISPISEQVFELANTISSTVEEQSSTVDELGPTMDDLSESPQNFSLSADSANLQVEELTPSMAKNVGTLTQFIEDNTALGIALNANIDELVNRLEEMKSQAQRE